MLHQNWKRDSDSEEWESVSDNLFDWSQNQYKMVYCHLDIKMMFALVDHKNASLYLSLLVSIPQISKNNQDSLIIFYIFT